MLPYEVDRRVALADGVPYALDAPTRANLVGLIITGLTDADKVNLYSRKLADSVNVINIVSDGAASPKCVINLETELMAREGDIITVAGNGVVGYNTTHTIVKRRQSDGRQYLTDVAYTADGSGGTAATNFAALAALYRVIPEQTVASSLVNWAGDAPYVNNDPKQLYDGALRDQLWIVADASATVRIVAKFRLPEGLS